MDEKDRTIERQMEKIREMTQRNLRRMADDIWGAVGPLKEEPQKADKPAAPDMRDEVLEKQLEVIRRLSENGARDGHRQSVGRARARRKCGEARRADADRETRGSARGAGSGGKAGEAGGSSERAAWLYRP